MVLQSAKTLRTMLDFFIFSSFFFLIPVFRISLCDLIVCVCVCFKYVALGFLFVCSFNMFCAFLGILAPSCATKTCGLDTVVCAKSLARVLRLAPSDLKFNFLSPSGT